MAKAEDRGDYYRIPADVRDLNYSLYFSEGQMDVSFAEEYNSHNTHRMNRAEDGRPAPETRLRAGRLEDRDGRRMNVLVTGARGFIGRNLTAHLHAREGLHGHGCSTSITRRTICAPGWKRRISSTIWRESTGRETAEEFETGNAGLTREICRILRELGRTPMIVMSSSVQAELENPYGISKRHAEEALREFGGPDRSPGSHLSPKERIWQVVPAELQFGGGDVLPQHRERSADSDLGPRTANWSWFTWMTS